MMKARIAFTSVAVLLTVLLHSVVGDDLNEQSQRLARQYYYGGGAPGQPGLPGGYGGYGAGLPGRPGLPGGYAYYSGKHTPSKGLLQKYLTDGYASDDLLSYYYPYYYPSYYGGYGGYGGAGGGGGGGGGGAPGMPGLPGY